MIRLPLLDENAPDHFPDPRTALIEPNGLLAFGGDLSPERLTAAYSHGIFPWFNEGEPILWWSPDPRCVFETEALRPNRSLRRALADTSWHVTVDRAFRDVMLACAAPRAGQAGTWISRAMIDAYVALHEMDRAHSVEVWDGEQLVGGIYGVSIGRLFAVSPCSARAAADRSLHSARLLHGFANGTVHGSMRRSAIRICLDWVRKKFPAARSCRTFAR
jgi:leucyl/phenylalanyl-tRNA--protein transferase